MKTSNTRPLLFAQEAERAGQKNEMNANEMFLELNGEMRCAVKNLKPIDKISAAMRTFKLLC